MTRPERADPDLSAARASGAIASTSVPIASTLMPITSTSMPVPSTLMPKTSTLVPIASTPLAGWQSPRCPRPERAEWSPSPRCPRVRSRFTRA
eukprot:1181999-Prorocentrum_minimum.AAC.4